MSDLPVLQADVVVIGAGPAGAVAALNLAPFLRVLVIDRGGEPVERIGENLPAAASRLLRDMGLYEAFVAQGHLPGRHMRSGWGSRTMLESDEIRNLDGPGWYLDRRRFDAWLREVAAARGAAMLGDTSVRGIGRPDGASGPWRLDLLRGGRRLVADARFVIDASGRRAVMDRHLGGKREREPRDRLVCGWVFGTDAREVTDEAADGVMDKAANDVMDKAANDVMDKAANKATSDGGANELHAERAGWWYTSALPDRGRVLAFYTDADLPDARSAHSRDALLARMADVSELARHLAETGFEPDGAYGFCAAHTAAPDAVAGPGWLAIGDAALAFDPLSSQGLFNALYTGLAGAGAVYQFDAEKNLAAFDEYRRQIDSIRDAYIQNRLACYRLESRWADLPFWQRRR